MGKKTWRKSREFVCPHCEKDFDKERKLLSHVKDAHPNTAAEKAKNALNFIFTGNEG